MLRKLQKQKSNAGFTIIEVMIVLAIAGLILLIVFLAVPALQRNSRNTQRKNDVQAALGAVSEFESNNAGALPTAYSSNALTGAAGSTSAGVRLGYYTTITFATGTQSALGTDTLTLVTSAVCDPATAGATTTTGASARSIAAQYRIEGASGLVSTCTNS